MRKTLELLKLANYHFPLEKGKHSLSIDNDKLILTCMITGDRYLSIIFDYKDLERDTMIIWNECASHISNEINREPNGIIG